MIKLFLKTLSLIKFELLLKWDLQQPQSGIQQQYTIMYNQGNWANKVYWEMEWWLGNISYFKIGGFIYTIKWSNRKQLHVLFLPLPIWLAPYCRKVGKGSCKKGFFSSSSDMPLADDNEAPPPLHPSGWAPGPCWW